jgi:hypothetical protein
MPAFTLQPSSVPPGKYHARFLGVEDSTHIEYGVGLRWIFEILSGAHAGKRAARVTDATFTPRNSAGRMLTGLAGRPLPLGEAIEADEFVGREYTITIEPTAGGATRVGAVMAVTAI